MPTVTNTGEAPENFELVLPKSPASRPGARLRRASPADAGAMAEAVNMAGEGLPLHLWAGMAQPGEDPWQVGRRRALREEGSFSWRNAVVSEVDGKVAACLVGYRQPDVPEAIDYETMPAMFVGLQELENLAPGSWYVNVLATWPDHRGQGHATALLAAAEAIAADAGAAGLSIIVADTNAPARRLYEHIGCREVASRAAVKEDWDSPVENWVLLVKDLRA